MNVVVTDTSSWISYFKDQPCAELDLALKEGRVFLSPIVAAELLSSRLKPKECEELSSFLKELPLAETPFEHWQKVGALRAHAASKGIHLSTPDAHVAQCALDQDGYLLTEDKIFKKLVKISPLRLLSVPS